MLHLRVLILVLVSLILPGYIEAQYYSQVGQDRFVNDTFFRNMKNGVFIEFGAYNGVDGSNSCFFERELGWKGICIEPIPTCFEQLKKSRNCITLHGCIVPNPIREPKKFLHVFGYYEQWSGLFDSYETQHMQQLIRNLNDRKESYEIIDVPCFTLASLLDKYGITHINYLSIDTEGGELEFLKAFDFCKYHVDVITVEDNYHNQEFINLLSSKGFTLVKRINPDLVFVNKLWKGNLPSQSQRKSYKNLSNFN